MPKFSFHILLVLYCIILLFISFGETKTNFDKKSFIIDFNDNTIIKQTENYTSISIELKLNNCSNNCNHGTCQKDKCVCEIFYQGENCNERWRESSSWYGLFIFYSILVIIGNTMNFIIASREFYFVMKKTGHLIVWKWDAVPHLVVLIMFGTLIRIVFFAVDPHSERNIIDRVTTQIFLSASIILWLVASFLLIHVWIKVQIASRILGVDRIKFLIPVMPVIAVVCALVAFPLTIAAESADIFQTLYNLWMALVFIVLIVIMTGVSFRLRRILKEAEGFSQQHMSQSKVQKQTIYSTLLQKLTWYILLMDGVLVITIISLIIYIVIDAPSSRWKYIIIHTLFRLQEIILVLCTLMFIKKRTESGVSSTTATSNHSGSETRLSQLSPSSGVESFSSTTDLVPQQKVTFADSDDVVEMHA